MAFQQTQMRRSSNSRKLPDLPPYYYHTNFCDMLSFVEARYAHVFEGEHLEFLDGFQALSHKAQCLFVRVAGRKGRVFDTHKLSYPEISDLPAALRELERSGFIGCVTQDDYSECLNVMTKPDPVSYTHLTLPTKA